MGFMGIEWGTYNIMTCDGFSREFFGGCSSAWMGLVIVFFLTALARKWGGEEMDIPFSFLWALVLGMGLYVLAITFTGSMKFALLCGIIGMAAGGYGSGYIFGGGEGEVNYE